MARLLRYAAARGIAPGYVGRLLGAFEAGSKQSASAASTTAAAQELIEPLTQRELEVLRLLAAGNSNAEIARELVVSVNTIRTQVQSIYRKLNINNRVEASRLVLQLEQT